jgi:hypothetical protein
VFQILVTVAPDAIKLPFVVPTHTAHKAILVRLPYCICAKWAASLATPHQSMKTVEIKNKPMNFTIH